MDGNGRWAAARGLPRVAGHHAGAGAVRRAVEAAPALGISTLTLYAFSSDNWQRPAPEVAALMKLFRAYLLSETARCVQEGVRLQIIGRRDRLPADLLATLDETEAATRQGRTLHLRIAVDYSARDAIVSAAAKLQDGRAPSRESFSQFMGQDVDLLIRTGGEQRLSDFLLWESAYAELVFTRRMWPDFDKPDLEAALREFAGRERRFGGLLEPERNFIAASCTEADEIGGR
jgi:undecaprenyl diphosphate synthase